MPIDPGSNCWDLDDLAGESTGVHHTDRTRNPRQGSAGSPWPGRARRCAAATQFEAWDMITGQMEPGLGL